jgi:uncharacterized protein (UPF0261 family)
MPCCALQTTIFHLKLQAMTLSIIMLCSLDTKARGAQFLRDCIESKGARTILVDIGYGQAAKMAAPIGAREVAMAAGADIDDIRSMCDIGAASQLMMQGAILRVQELLVQGQCDGIIAFGGASDTTLATGVMKTLPIGIPKLMISSAAAMPAYSAMYFGSRDITMMHAVVDISGSNDLTRAFLERGGGGICGMAAASSGGIEPSQGSRLIAVTSFRFAEACSHAVMRELEQRGYNAIPFHAQGVGENAMENLVSQGMFEGVLDIVPAGLSEQMLGGNRAARPDRLEAAGHAGIPQVIATSGFDMISCGPITRKDSGDPLWEQRALAKRCYSVPDRYRVEARTTASEVADIASRVAEKLNHVDSPASVMVPVLGWSSLSVKGATLHDPTADAAFVPALKKTFPKGVICCSTIPWMDRQTSTKMPQSGQFFQFSNDPMGQTVIPSSRSSCSLARNRFVPVMRFMGPLAPSF